MRKVFFIFFLILWFRTGAQNLVLNPYFASGGNCNEIGGTMTFDSCCPYWYSLSGAYFNSCSTNLLFSTPSNAWGYQVPISGAGYASLNLGGVGPQYFDTSVIENSSEYLTGTLSSPLVAGGLYCVSYYISLADSSSLAAELIGAYFSNTMPNLALVNNFLPYTPQLVTSAGQYYTDKINWTHISAIYQATGGEQYLTIGRFDTAFDLIQIAPYLNGCIPCGNNSIYYIGEVSVVEVSSTFAYPLGADTVLCDTVGYSRVLSVSSLLYDSVRWGTGASTSQITVTHTGEYSVTCYSGDCVVTDSIHIGYQPPYQFTTYTDTTVCANMVPLTIAAQPGFSGYSWNTGDTTSDIAVPAAGSYTVSFQTICGEYHDTISVSTVGLPPPPGVSDTILCSNQPIGPISATGTALLWYSSDTSATGSVEAPIPDASEASQTYYVTQTLHGCTSAEASVTVYILSPPILAIGPDQIQCSGISIALGDAPDAMTHYLWNTGDTTSIIRADSQAIYICSATNACGTTTASVSVTYTDCDSQCMYVPNAFTPNGDGINDLFEVFPRCPIAYFELQVFDRWGEKVFETNDLSYPWDGTYRGYPQAPGVYAYNLYLTNEAGETEQRKGSITLIR